MLRPQRRHPPGWRCADGYGRQAGEDSEELGLAGQVRLKASQIERIRKAEDYSRVGGRVRFQPLKSCSGKESGNTDRGSKFLIPSGNQASRCDPGGG